MTIGLIIYAFVVLFLAMQVPAASFSPVTDAQFQGVFGQSLWIIVGSVVAFALSQLVDVFIFWLVRHKTGGRYLSMRATGSTVVSQLIDSVVIIGIAFWLPGKVKTTESLTVAASNYSFKLIIALSVTPLLYAGHAAIDRYLGEEEAHELIEQSAKASAGSGAVKRIVAAVSRRLNLEAGALACRHYPHPFFLSTPRPGLLFFSRLFTIRQ